MKNIKHIIYLLILLLLFNGLLQYNNNVRTADYLESKTEQYKENYNVLYKGHKELSKVIFVTIIDTIDIKKILKKTITTDEDEKNKARRELYVHLEETYSYLKQFDIKQLHFHLPNNESFLRFHKPKKFGDDLTDIRATVKYVNENKKPIDGFEEGRVYNGFRFVFPLFMETTYLGSVEVSMSTFSMNVEMMKNHNIIGKFLILKSVVDEKVLKQLQSNYVQSKLEDFLFEKSIAKQVKKYNKSGIKIVVSDYIKRIVKENKDSEKSFSLYDKDSDTVMSFLKVKNPVTEKVVGMFVFRSNPLYIKQQMQNTFFLQLVLSVLILLLYMFFQKKSGEKRILAALVEEKTKELISSQNKMSNYIDLIDKHIITSSTDLSGIITEASEAFCKISGYSKNELIGTNHNIVRDPKVAKSFYAQLWEKLKQDNFFKGEVRNKAKDGSYYWVDVTIEPSYDENGYKIGYTSIRQDITDKKLVEQISITDGLTNIYNRRHFNELFPKVINSAKRDNVLVSFLIMDIDYFKQYNDTYGHQMGDNALVEVAKLLKSSLHRSDDHCFRLGGEEFGIIFKSDTKEKAYEFSKIIRENIENLQIEHKGNSTSPYITVSMGLICKLACEINSDDEVYKEADDLLYKAKESGRNKVCF